MPFWFLDRVHSIANHSHLLLQTCLLAVHRLSVCSELTLIWVAGIAQQPKCDSLTGWFEKLFLAAECQPKLTKLWFQSYSMVVQGYSGSCHHQAWLTKSHSDIISLWAVWSLLLSITLEQEQVTMFEKDMKVISPLWTVSLLSQNHLGSGLWVLKVSSLWDLKQKRDSASICHKIRCPKMSQHAFFTLTVKMLNFHLNGT